MSRRIEAALSLEIVEQYVGGAEGRVAEIEDGATRAADVIAALPQRCDQRALMAWAVGRGPAPELEPWG